MARIDFERLVARLHVDRILDGLGFQPTGIHVIIVPETSISNVWQDAAALAVRDIRNFRQGGAKAPASPKLWTSRPRRWDRRKPATMSIQHSCAITCMIRDIRTQ